MTTENTSPLLSDAQRWGMGLCALLTEMNGYSHHTLFSDDDHDEERFCHAKILKRDWGIATRADLLEQLEWLRNDGHNGGYMWRLNVLSTMSEAEKDAFIASRRDDETDHSNWVIVRHNVQTLDKIGIAAWDEGRYVHLCRAGMILKFLGETEGWTLIMDMARRVQQKYDNWYHFAVSYMVGRQYWRSDATQEFIHEMMHILKGLAGKPHSPWNSLDWNLPLDNVATFAAP